MSTAVDRLFEEAKATLALLQKDPESLSLWVSAGDNFRKTILLAAASYFEHAVCRIVIEFVTERSKGSVLIPELVRNKAIARQYHTWFNWEDRNANQFFGLFGVNFKVLMADNVKTSEKLRDSIKAFLEIGSERNRLVHQDFATFTLEKTIDEIYEKYKLAEIFVGLLAEFLRNSDPD